jgi:hypothetical protein
MMKLWKKIVLIPPLLFALWLLADKQNGSSFAVVVALSRHPPSLRVYRALLEVGLMLLCGSLSLIVWEYAAGTRVVGILLFRPPQPIQTSIRGIYQAVPASLPDDDNALTEEEAQDACYASDGEVQEEEDVEYSEPPTAASIAHSAVDLLLLVLVSLFLFTISSAEGGKYIEGMTTIQWVASIAAPVFPLLLFLWAVFKAFFPLSKRRDFWTVVAYTPSAPMLQVTFRYVSLFRHYTQHSTLTLFINLFECSDGFIGDVFTSTVRPLQDVAFTVFYCFSGLRGWWTQAYDLDSAQLPLETSWLLHTCVLPACMVSPLWWRFLQNLRQCYDTKQRWPYLGNAFKYFIAASVSMMGLFDPSKKNNVLWILCFVFATLYQSFWDVFMDWELLEFQGGTKPKLRSARLYPSKTMYWVILIVNFVLRFCWTLSFLPRFYLNSDGMLERTFHGHFSRLHGPIIASAEIIRRAMWGFLRLELEAIKTCRDDDKLSEQLKQCSSPTDNSVDGDGIEMKDMTKESRIPLAFETWDKKIEIASDMSARSDVQILVELCLYATAFAAIGMLAAAHRETM